MSSPTLEMSADPAPLNGSGLHTVLALTARDLRVLRRDIVGFAARTLVQPVLFTFVFTFVLPSIGSSPGGGGGAFASVLLPGLIASTAVLTGMTTVTIGLMTELGYTKEIEDRILTPAPLWLLGTQKILWGSVHSLLAGLLVVPVTLLIHAPGQGPKITAANPALLAFVFVIVPLLSASIGLLLGTVLEAQRFNTLISFIMVPSMMLGCVYYPWARLHPLPWLQALVLLNPIVYASEGLRAALVPGVGHMPVLAIVLVLLLGTATIAGTGLRTFARRCVS